MYKKIGLFLLVVFLLFGGLSVHAEWANPNPQSGGDNAGELLLKHESNMTDIYQSNTGKLNLLKKNFSGTASPSSSDEGQAWWDSTNNTFNLYDGSAFGQVFPDKAATVTTSGDTYSVTLTPAIASYIANTDYHITFTSANTTTTPTLNINALGAKTITKEGNTALAVGDIAENYAGILRYNGTNMVLLNPKTTAAFVGYASTFAHAYRSAALNIPQNVTTKIALDAESYDTGGNMDIVTNNRYNVPSTGVYFIDAGVDFSEAFGDGLLTTVHIYLNGASIARNQQSYGYTSSYPVVRTATIYYLTAGQYVELYVLHAAGEATRALDVNSPAKNYLRIIRIW